MLKPCPPNYGGRRTRQSGLSLVELMVGITVGMIVVAGASVMMVNQLAEHRRLILETQVQQDLRAAADLMLRDLRRAGFWATPERGVWASGGAAPAAAAASNPYTGINTETAEQINYRYSRANNYTNQWNLTPSAPQTADPTASENFGFRRTSAGVLQFNLGGTWQPLTDSNTLIITEFRVTPRVQTLPLADYCAAPCPTGLANCPPEQQIRLIEIVLTGRATHDANVVRTINVSSRIRNDNIIGSCS